MEGTKRQDSVIRQIGVMPTSWNSLDDQRDARLTVYNVCAIARWRAVVLASAFSE